MRFALFILAVPYRGRAIPFQFITYSSRTIAAEGSSRDLEHRRAKREVKELIGDKPVVMDREFSYERLFADFAEEGIEFVCRLNIGNHPTFKDEEGNKSAAPGERVFHRGLYYKGKVRVNVAGEWGKGFTNLEPEEGLRIYKARMKIDESFKDLKSLLNLEKVMNKKREQMEKVVALVLLAYAIGLLVGEALRDRMYGGEGGEVKGAALIPAPILDQEGRGDRSGSSTRGYSSCSSRSSDWGERWFVN